MPDVQQTASSAEAPAHIIKVFMMNSEHTSRRMGDSGDSQPDFAAPLSRDLIELLSRLGHLLQPLKHPTSPQKRLGAIEIARNILLAILEFVDTNKAPSDPGIDRVELAELIEQVKQSEKLVGRETWAGLFRMQSNFLIKQDESYQQLGVELVSFFRRQFRMFDKLIEGVRYTPVWEDAYETFLDEFSSRW